MLIFGFRIYTALVATLSYVCENCGQQAAHHLTRRTRKFTLFFVPLVPVSTRYLDTCTYCGRVLEVQKEQAESAVTQLR